MKRPVFIAKRFGQGLQNLLAMGMYPFVRHELIKRLSSTMIDLSIETTNICNANCVFCAYQYQERTKGIMPMELFKKVIDEYANSGGCSLGLTPTVGDPLVDPKLLERISYARAHPEITRIGMYTNMILLKRFTTEALVESGLTHLIVSTSGFDEAMYERIYRSKQYGTVFFNIKDFAEANNRAGKPVDFRVEMRLIDH